MKVLNDVVFDELKTIEEFSKVNSGREKAAKEFRPRHMHGTGNSRTKWDAHEVGCFLVCKKMMNRDDCVALYFTSKRDRFELEDEGLRDF